MFEAILFDLDGTLLDIDMNFFLPQYFKKMIIMADKYGIKDTKHLVNQVYKSTDVMIANKNPFKTNEEVFIEDFLNNFNITKDKALDFFNYFYTEGFPELKEYCRPFPGIPQMMNNIFDRGFKVVIATNAVFPRLAIIERLKWAGVAEFDYKLVTSYEIMHFCKPHPEYYEEIANSIGVIPQKCLMVGNDIGEDLIAGKVGMKTFLVEDRLIDKGVNLKPDWRGKLQSLFSFFNKY